MIKIASYETDIIFKAIDRTNKVKFSKANLRSKRILNFKVNGTKCVECGINGNVFIVERSSPQDKNPHLNLYAVGKGGNILMTKDHIRPISKGGNNCFHNIQPMCRNCNSRKSSRYNLIDKYKYIASIIRNKINGNCKCDFKRIF